MAKNREDDLYATPTGEKRFRIPKNLMLVVMGILIAVVVLFLAAQAMTQKPVQKVEGPRPPAPNIEKPGMAVVDRIAEEQMESARKAESERLKQEREAHSNVPTQKNDGKEGALNVLPKIPAPDQSDAVDMAGRELAIRSAPILAINDSMALDGMFASKKDEEGPSSDLQGVMADRERLAKTLDAQARAVMPTPEGDPRQPSRAQLERDWLKETAQIKAPQQPLTGSYPRSKFMLLQGDIINATLLNGMNTDIPGEVRAQISMDVYDSMGRGILLIPKGTRLIGTYNSEIQVGQDRINTVFTRMILPNGLSVQLDGNRGMGIDGSAGLPGEVDNHYFRMLYVSLLTAMGAAIVDRTSGSTTTANQNGQVNEVKYAGQILTDINQAIIRRNIVTPATITKPVGDRFTITVSRDIELPPYKALK